jgi:hypothetical protein
MTRSIGDQYVKNIGVTWQPGLNYIYKKLNLTQFNMMINLLLLLLTEYGSL